MTSKDDPLGGSVDLRLRAEDLMDNAGATPGDGASLSAEEFARTLHELQVHQIELELQNEELRRAQMELDAVRERYFDLYDLAPVGYCTLSEPGLILEANLTAAQLFGVARGALLRQPITRFVWPQDQDIHYRQFKQLLEVGGPRAWELRMQRKDSVPFWARVDAAATRGMDGASVYRITLSDISELKRKELVAENRQLKLTHRQHLAQQRSESMGTLASGIAHDINNLLGVVLAQADLAQAELASGRRPDEELNRIRAVALRGSEIGRQLMIYAGHESAALVLVEVSRTIEDMIELLKVSVSKHAALETDLGRDLPPITASPFQLRRVVMNLVINASEAIGVTDGLIRVTTKQVKVGPDWALTTGQLVEGDYVQLEVSDTGRGMSPDTHARVFDSRFTTKSLGHGLGLAIVNEIVRSLRGAIRLESALGKGSRFQILLPCARYSRQSTNTVISPDREDAVQLRSGTLLMVEDEESLRRPLSKMIRKEGYSVLEAGDGSAALDLIRAHPDRIDVLLLDITLPGASSREVFEEACRIRPEMSIIVTSAYTAAAAAASLGAKVESFIRKPYRLNDLMPLIRHAQAEQQASMTA